MQRIDTFLVEHDLVESREQAKRLILAGAVTVNGNASIKPGHRIPDDAEVIVKEREKYVSRGGVKLEKALNTFKVDVRNRVALDVGASTGGFTDCLLQHGAEFVYAVDVGYGQLAWKLRTHPQVKSIEKTNIRHLTPSEVTSDQLPVTRKENLPKNSRPFLNIGNRVLGQSFPNASSPVTGDSPPVPGDFISIAVIDVSFISLRTVLPSVIKLLLKLPVTSYQLPEKRTYPRTRFPILKNRREFLGKVYPNASLLETGDSPPVTGTYDIIALLKPQFEAGKAHVKKGGVVSDKQVHIETIDNLSTFVTEKLGATVNGVTYSPIHKDIRNIEYLLWLTINPNPDVSRLEKYEKPKQTTAEIVAAAHESFENGS